MTTATRDLEPPGWWHSYIRAVPRWRIVVWAVVAAGGAAVALAVADVVARGVQRPAAAAIGLAMTVVVNRVYVVVARHGQVMEGIDIAEIAIVALALLLPPGEAVLAFAAASALVEMMAGRARIKKLFNVSIRAAGALLVVIPIAIVGRASTPTGTEIVAAVAGAAAYAIVNAMAVAAVAASVQRQPMLPMLREDLGPRVLVWTLAVVAGASSGYAAMSEPVVLLGTLAAVGLVLTSADAARRSQRDSRRLHLLLDAATTIQAMDSLDEQESVLVQFAHDLLLWKDVSIRTEPPGDDERGSRLHTRDGSEQWLVAARREGSDDWTVEDERVIDTLAGAAVVAVERARMQTELAHQALVDPLTGIANRRRFDDEVAQLAASGRPRYGVILCDLDHFKSVNDRLGHDAGDDLLRIAAARLTACVRAGDLVARLGGDEFVVLMPGVTSRETLEAARAKIAAKFDEPVKVGRWRLSCLPSSFGLASTSRDGRTLRDVLRAADESMYDVKRQHRAGRPRLTVTLPESRRPPEPMSPTERPGRGTHLIVD